VQNVVVNVTPRAEFPLDNFCELNYN